MYKRICVLVLLLCWGVGTVRAQQPDISSASAVIMEAESGYVVFEKDAHTPRPMASTTKLMTALVAAEMLPLQHEITVSAEAVAVEGSALGLRAGDQITLSDLLTGLLLTSGNDAANVTAMAVAGDIPAFATLMNTKAQALGMQNSGFVTPSGLDAQGHAASAYDMGLLGCAVLRQPFLRKVCATWQTTVQFGQPKKQVWVTNHNRLLKLSNDCIGMKTGYTKKSGKCLVSAAERDGVTVVAVTLNGGDYWNDHLKLYEYAFDRLERVQVDAPPLQPISIAGGMQDTVSLHTQPPPAVTKPKNDAPSYVTEIELPAFLWAPIEKGETVGHVRYRYADGEIVSMPILAVEMVAARPRVSIREQFLENFKRCIFALWE